LTFNEEFMKKALKRVNELQQEMIEKSKKVPNSEAFVKVWMEDFYRTHELGVDTEFITLP